MKTFLVVAVLVLCAPVNAKELPYPPTYLSTYLVNLQMADWIAGRCEKLRLNEQYVGRTQLEMLARLEADGFSRTSWREQMKPVPKGLRDQIETYFYLKWGVRADRPKSECAAGRHEISRGLAVGKFLTIVD